MGQGGPITEWVDLPIDFPPLGLGYFFLSASGTLVHPCGRISRIYLPPSIVGWVILHLLETGWEAALGEA